MTPDEILPHLITNHDQIEKEYKQSEERRAIVRKSIKKHRNTYAARNKERDKQMRTDKKWHIIKHLGGVCNRCKFEPKTDDDLCIMDFHHRDPKTKKYNLCSAMGRSIPNLLTEADKCDLVCANCHRRIEAGQI